MMIDQQSVLQNASNQARQSIFSKIQHGLALGKGKGLATPNPLREQPAPRSPMPNEHAGLVQRFIDEAEALSATVSHVDNLAGVVEELIRYGKEVIPDAKRWVVSPELQTMLWPMLSNIKLALREANAEDEVGITGAFCAIADTGTLLLMSGANTPTTVGLLPETHIVILPVNRVVGYMEDAWNLWQQEHPNDPTLMPRAANFVSGPSRTGDIEQTIVLGAHGPCRVHIILVDSVSA